MTFKKPIKSELLSTGGVYLMHWLFDAQQRQLHSDLNSILNRQVFIRLRIYHRISEQIHNDLQTL